MSAACATSRRHYQGGDASIANEHATRMQVACLVRLCHASGAFRQTEVQCQLGPVKRGKQGLITGTSIQVHCLHAGVPHGQLVHALLDHGHRVP